MIRQARHADIKEIYKLGSLINANFKKIYNIEDELLDKNKLIIVKVKNNLIAAFVQVIILTDEIDIINIVVKPDYQNQGIAISLMNYLFNMFINYQYFLEVSVHNIKAINLYKKIDFKIINIRPKYYHNVDAYIMKKE